MPDDRPAHVPKPALRVVVAGGGVAGLEALLALRADAGALCDLTLLAPGAEFAYRPHAVTGAFGLGAVHRYPLAPIVRDAQARFVTGAVAEVDDDAGALTTDDGRTLPFDALLLATGARAVPALPGAATWDDTTDAAAVHELLLGLQSAAIRRLALVVPPGPRWPLPAYELALLLARRARGVGADPELFVVTPERSPAAAFGAAPSEEVAAELEAAGVRFEGSATAAPAPSDDHTLLLGESGRPLTIDRVVALPRLLGRAPRGVPADAHGFIPTGRHGEVTGLRRVWAAGDGTAFPVKHGSLAAQQADAAAAAIAARAGAA